MFSFQGAAAEAFAPALSFLKTHGNLIIDGISVSFQTLFLLENGGPKWTRTTDLTIISRVL